MGGGWFCAVCAAEHGTEDAAEVCGAACQVVRSELARIRAERAQQRGGRNADRRHEGDR